MTSTCHRFTFVAILIALFSCLTINANTAAANTPDITVDPEAIEIILGQTGTVTVTSTDPAAPITDATTIKWTGLGEEIEEVETKIVDGKAVTTFKVTKFFSGGKNVAVKVGDIEKAVAITTATPVKLTNFPNANPEETVALKQDDSKEIGLVNLGGATIRSEELELESSPESIATATRKGTTIVIRGVKPGTAQITVKSNGHPIKTYNVTVAEAVDRIDTDVASITLNEGQELPLKDLNVRVVAKSNNNLAGTDEFRPKFTTTDSNLAEVIANTTLKARRAPTDGEQPKLIITSGDSQTIIPIRISPAATTINLRGISNTVLAGKSETFSVEVINSQGNRIPDAQVSWSVPTEDQGSLAIMNAQDTQVTVQGLGTPKDNVKLVATLTSPATVSPVTRTFLINVRSAAVAGFAPLEIRIDLLDSQTAKDLFGRKAADEFFISKIRLFNKLRNLNGEYGDSILVYSESLEVRVQLEMKDKKGNGEWQAVKDVSGANGFQAMFGSPWPFPAIVGNPACKDTPQPHFVARYRPYTFDIVANTHDRRDERSTRTRILTVANGLASFASFVTTVAVPKSSNDTILGLDQFKGLLIPSFEKLFPSLKEVQRQNIITMVMRPLEEIPFGSDVSRIIFIPKGRLYGMIPGKIFRIGGVSVAGACAEVGIVKKAGSSL